MKKQITTDQATLDQIVIAQEPKTLGARETTRFRRWTRYLFEWLIEPPELVQLTAPGREPLKRDEWDKSYAERPPKF